MKRVLFGIILVTAMATLTLAQTEKLDYAMLGRIRDQGLNHSQVMDIVSWLSDVYGPRLTGSPGATASRSTVPPNAAATTLTPAIEERGP